MEHTPSIVAHCDWSMRAEKRWMATATRREDGWTLDGVELVGDASTLLGRLQGRRKEAGPLLAGFDFPIGLPEQYGRLTHFRDFRSALREFGQGEWSDWYNVAERSEDLSIQRPFYPMRPGGTRRTHLIAALGVPDANDLLRSCERATDQRRAACMLFWTLGGNQVGKAAITGWLEIVAPHADEVALWPFDGPLAQVLASAPTVLAETYPGEVYHQIGIPRSHRWSKRRPEGRRSVASYLQSWLRDRPSIDWALLAEPIASGFAPGAEGEDQFDAVVGLLGMLEVVDGRHPEAPPLSGAALRWEGWILGQL